MLNSKIYYRKYKPKYNCRIKKKIAKQIIDYSRTDSNLQVLLLINNKKSVKMFSYVIRQGKISNDTFCSIQIKSTLNLS